MTDDPADFGSGLKKGDRVRIITKANNMPHATVIKVDPMFGDDGSWRGDIIRVTFDGHDNGGRGVFADEMVEKLSAVERLGDVADE